MSPFKNDSEEHKKDGRDAAEVDPRVDYEPPETEAQGGTGEGTDQGG